MLPLLPVPLWWENKSLGSTFLKTKPLTLISMDTGHPTMFLFILSFGTLVATLPCISNTETHTVGQSVHALKSLEETTQKLLISRLDVFIILFFSSFLYSPSLIPPARPAPLSPKTLKQLQRYNSWQTDPLSLKDACRGISARCDLNSPYFSNGTLNGYAAFGAIDCKVTSSRLASEMRSEAVSGPTYDAQPIFWWSKAWDSVPHKELPLIYAFDFVEME